MTFETALKIMAGKAHGNRGQALDVIKVEVLTHSARGKGGTIDNIGDWLSCRGWSGNETAQELASEWDNDEE